MAWHFVDDGLHDFHLVSVVVTDLLTSPIRAETSCSVVTRCGIHLETYRANVGLMTRPEVPTRADKFIDCPECRATLPSIRRHPPQDMVGL